MGNVPIGPTRRIGTESEVGTIVRIENISMFRRIQCLELQVAFLFSCELSEDLERSESTMEIPGDVDLARILVCKT